MSTTIVSASFKNSTIEMIGAELAHPFIERWHYSERVPTGKNIFFGWFVGLFELYAVADYGIGINPYQSKFLSKETGESVTNSGLLELKRLCRSEPKQEGYPLTAFLARCHKLLKRRDYEYSVSFSDPSYGHNGGVYKAANFDYLGKTNAEYHVVDQDGNARHRRYPYRYARRNNVTIQEAREELGLERIKTLPKDRWFLRL